MMDVGDIIVTRFAGYILAFECAGLRHEKDPLGVNHYKVLAEPGSVVAHHNGRTEQVRSHEVFDYEDCRLANATEQEWYAHAVGV